jgi:exonuclease III
MMQWNTNSIQLRKHELEHFLHSDRIDIAALCETKLTPQKRFTLPGYVIYRHDRNQHGGGVCLPVSRDIQHDGFDLPCTSRLETIAVVVNTNQCPNLLVISGYNPPTNIMRRTDLREMFSPSMPTVLMGDFNGKQKAWNCKSNNTTWEHHIGLLHRSFHQHNCSESIHLLSYTRTGKLEF